MFFLIFSDFVPKHVPNKHKQTTQCCRAAGAERQSLEGATCPAPYGQRINAPSPALAKVGKVAGVGSCPGVFIKLRKNSQIEDIPASICTVRPGP